MTADRSLENRLNFLSIRIRAGLGQALCQGSPPEKGLPKNAQKKKGNPDHGLKSGKRTRWT